MAERDSSRTVRNRMYHAERVIRSITRPAELAYLRGVMEEHEQELPRLRAEAATADALSKSQLELFDCGDAK